MEPYGYYVGSGYLGRIENGTYILFPTESDYIEWISLITEEDE